MIDTLAINTDAFQPDSAEISEYREPVTLARSLFDNLPEEDQQALDADGTLNLLVQAEARVLNLWIRDTPLDSVEDSGITWIMEERYDAVSEALGEDAAKELVPLSMVLVIPGYYPMSGSRSQTSFRNGIPRHRPLWYGSSAV